MSTPSLTYLNEPAPEYSALTTHGEHGLADHMGKGVIRFSNPVGLAARKL